MALSCILVAANDPWHSSVYAHITPVSAPIFTSPSSVCVWLLPVSLKKTLVIYWI